MMTGRVLRAGRWLRLIAVWLLAMNAAGGASAEPIALQPDKIQVLYEGRTENLAAVALPFRWDHHHRGSGEVRFEFSFALPAGQPTSLYLPRIGNSYRVWHNDRLLADETGPVPASVNTVYQPRLVTLREGRTGGLERLRIDIVAISGADGGLSAVLLGPAAEMAALHSRALRWRVGGALAVSVMSLVLGSLALLVWMQQRERLYLWYALAELLWSFRTAGYYLTDHAPLPWTWWGLLMKALYCGAIASMCYFGLALVMRHRTVWGLMVRIFLVASLALLALSFALERNDWWLHWRVAILAISMTCAAVVAREAWQRRSREAIALGAVCAVALAAGVRDWLTITVARANYEAVPLVTYVWALFGLAMAWLLTNRLRQATQAQLGHTREMALRLQAQEAELEHAFARQREHAQQQAATEERRRVLQDMHDGVGHELLGALHVAREGTVSREAVTEQIQRAMDHLKLTVDVLQEGAQDVATILGLLRYRLAPRLQACGIAIQWQVPELPPLSSWDTRHARDLQLLLYEAFTNLLVHSGATGTFFEASVDAASHTLRIRLADNGRGVDPNAARGNGLTSMQARAARLNAAFSICNGVVPGFQGACVEVQIPLAEPVPALSDLPEAG